MLNCFKKFFVIFLFFSFLPLTHAMENGANASKNMLIGLAPLTAVFLVQAGVQKYNQCKLNAELWNALVVTRNNDFSQADFVNIGNCLDKGADPNSTNGGGLTPISYLIYANHFTGNMKLLGFLEFLITRGVDVNKRNSFAASYHTSLELAVSYQKHGEIKFLCGAGASLVDAVKFPWSYGNIFHCAWSKETIKALITHGRFDTQQAIINQDQQKKLRAIIFSLKKWGGRYQAGEKKYITLPGEIQDQIIAYLPMPEYFQDPDNKLCWRLLGAGYKTPLVFAHVNKRVAWINKLLESSSLVRGTALKYMLSRNYISAERKEELRPLFDGSLLDEHYHKFNAEFPHILESDPENLVCEMFNNCAKLLEEK